MGRVWVAGPSETQVSNDCGRIAGRGLAKSKQFNETACRTTVEPMPHLLSQFASWVGLHRLEEVALHPKITPPSNLDLGPRAT